MKTKIRVALTILPLFLLVYAGECRSPTAPTALVIGGFCGVTPSGLTIQCTDGSIPSNKIVGVSWRALVGGAQVGGAIAANAGDSVTFTNLASGTYTVAQTVTPERGDPKTQPHPDLVIP